jgi:hypothetical protein
MRSLHNGLMMIALIISNCFWCIISLYCIQWIIDVNTLLHYTNYLIWEYQIENIFENKDDR